MKITLFRPSFGSTIPERSVTAGCQEDFALLRRERCQTAKEVTMLFPALVFLSLKL